MLVLLVTGFALLDQALPGPGTPLGGGVPDAAGRAGPAGRPPGWRNAARPASPRRRETVRVSPVTRRDIATATPAEARRLRADRARQVADVLRRQVLYREFRSGVLPPEADVVRDADDLVRAAALEALAGIGCPPPLDSAAAGALHAPAWQVRTGAARGLASAPPDTAAGPLIKARAHARRALSEAR